MAKKSTLYYNSLVKSAFLVEYRGPASLKEEVGSVHNKEWFPFDFPLILVIFDHFLSEILGALTSNRR